MILSHMIIEGFKSFKTQQTFHFGKTKGVYFLKGKNNQDSLIGSNGAGKSSVWDALTWVQYGKTVRGLKAGDLHNWLSDSKGYSVKLFGENRGEDFTLFRSWHPNKIELTIGKKTIEVEQYQVDEFLGIPYTPYLFSILMGQTRDMFFDLKDTEKSTLLTEVFSLDKWLTLSEKAATDAKEMEYSISLVDIAIYKKQERILILNSGYKEYKDLASAWEKEKAERETVLSDELQTLQEGNKDLFLELEECVKERKEIEAEIKEVSVDTSDRVDVLAKFQLRMENLKSVLLTHRTFIDLKEEEIQYFRDYSRKGNYPCTLCGQSISVGYANNQIKTLKAAILERGKQYAEGAQSKKRCRATVTNAQKLINDLEIEGRQLSENLGSVNADITHARMDIERSDKAIIETHRKLLKINKETSPFNNLMRDNNYMRFSINSNITKLNRVKTALQEKKEHSTFWVKGFKDVRLYMISEFLIQLEIEVNSALHKLGLIDWSITFDIERETKSKTVRKGFSVLIKSPLNEKPVPWESWSGGESQRLRLAGNMGLSSLILSQYGINPNIEIWDEPSSHMNGEEGINSLLETLSDRAEMLDKSLWIIEHNTLDFGGFVQTVTVEKGENGSIIN